MKISHLIAVHTLITAVSGILLAAILFFNFSNIEEMQIELNQDSQTLSEVKRLQENYQQWLIMMDLIIGNQQFYLITGTKLQTEFSIHILDAIKQSRLTATIQQELDETDEILSKNLVLLEQMEQGTTLESVSQFDEDTEQTTAFLHSIAFITEQYSQENLSLFEQRRANLIWLNILATTLYILLVIGLWYRLTKQFVRPVEQLTEAVNVAYSKKKKFDYADDNSPYEISLLSQNAHDYINNLENKVIERTELYKMERDKALFISDTKSRFLSSMSHELRTPLHAVIGFAELLLSDHEHPLSKEQLESITQINVSGNHLLQLINQMLNMSDLDNEGSNLILETTNLNELLSFASFHSQTLAHQKSIELNCDVNTQTQLFIDVDKKKMKQVLLTLISSAVQLHSSLSLNPLYLSCSSNNSNSAKVDINNITIEDDSLKTRLKDFFENSNSTIYDNPTILNTEIGLSICKRLVEMMRGKISVLKNDDGSLCLQLEFKLSRPTSPPKNISDS